VTTLHLRRRLIHHLSTLLRVNREPTAVAPKQRPPPTPPNDVLTALVARLDAITPAIAPAAELEAGLRALASDGVSVRALQPDEDLFKAGSNPDEYYWVLCGSLDEWGGGLRVAVRRPGELAGEIAALTPRRANTTTCVARERTEVAVLKASALQRLINRHGPLTDELLRGVAEHAERWSLAYSQQFEDISKEYFPGKRAMLVPAPYSAVKAELLIFAAKKPADGLSETMPPGVTWHPDVPFFYVTVNHFPDFHDKNAAQSVKMTYSEIATMVPVQVEGHPGIHLFYPYLFADNMMALFSGREVYGLPKMGAVTYLDNDLGRAMMRAGDDLAFSVRYRDLGLGEDARHGRRRALEALLHPTAAAANAAENHEDSGPIKTFVKGIAHHLEHLAGDALFGALQVAIDAGDAVGAAELFSALPPALRTVSAVAWKRNFSPCAALPNPGPVPWQPTDFDADGAAQCLFEVTKIHDFQFIEVPTDGLVAHPNFILHDIELWMPWGARMVIDMDMLPGAGFLIDFLHPPATDPEITARLAWGPAVWNQRGESKS